MFIPVTESLVKLSKLFPEDLYIVGGYVRNCILGIKSQDIDLASNMDIEEVCKILKDNGYKIKVKNYKYNSITISKGMSSLLLEKIFILIMAVTNQLKLKEQTALKKMQVAEISQ